MIDNEAQQIRQQADRAAIDRLMAAAPHARDVGPHAPGVISSPERVLEKLPRDPSKRRKEVEAQLASYRTTLARSIRHYEKIRTTGLDSVDDYDLVIAYGGDAWNACRMNLSLVSAHISYDRSMIQALKGALALLEADANKHRVTVHERIRVALPPQKAFIVQKWAEAAKTPFKIRKERAAAQFAPGVLTIDTRLPAHQAFIVGKWAV